MLNFALAAVATAFSTFTPRSDAPPAVQQSPAEVRVGMYLIDMDDIDLAAGTVRIDAYVWLTWPAEKFRKPGEGATDAQSLPPAPCDVIELPDGQEIDKTIISSRPGYACLRIAGTVRQVFSLRSFPFDNHVLKIAFEDADSDTRLVRMFPDERGSAIGTFETAGWEVGQLSSDLRVRNLDSTFGDPSSRHLGSTTYQAAVFSIPIKQSSLSYALKTLCALIISSLLALAALLIRPTDCDPRFGLPVGALFACVASLWVIGESLPPRTPATAADMMHIVSFMLILVVVLVSIVSLRRLEGGDEEGSKRLDRTALFMSLPIYLASNAFIMAFW